MRHAFTFLELMIVIAMIAIMSAIAIPNMIEAKMSANESAVSATMKSGIAPAQELFKSAGHNDQDCDNVGEYTSCFSHLSGDVKTFPNMYGDDGTPEGNIELLGPEWISTYFDRWRNVSDYRYSTTIETIHSYNWGLTTNTADRSSFDGSSESQCEQVDNAEKYWNCAATPEDWGYSGRRSFIIFQTGTVYAKMDNDGTTFAQPLNAWSDAHGHINYAAQKQNRSINRTWNRLNK